MAQTYTYIVYKGEKFYVAENLEYGVVSQGKTEAEAVANLQGALELYLEDVPQEKVPVRGATIGKLKLAR